MTGLGGLPRLEEQDLVKPQAPSPMQITVEDLKRNTSELQQIKFLLIALILITLFKS